MISLFGSSGFIGSRYYQLNTNACVSINREDNTPKSSNILYFISTTDNYNVKDNPHLDIETNLTKLVSVLEECRKLNETEQVTFNFISSWFVYGKTTEYPVNETSQCNPTGFYSITKFAAERLLVSYCETFGIKYRILRLTNIIGSTDTRVSSKKNAIQYMINLLKENSEVRLYDGGDNIRDYMHVDDCCSAINTVINSSPINTIINISNSEPTKIKDIIYYAKDKLKSTSKIISIPTPHFHKIVQIENIYLDNSRLIMLGYKPSISTYQAIDTILGSSQ